MRKETLQNLLHRFLPEWDKAMAKARAVLGMVNRRDGGRAIISVNCSPSVVDRIGLTESQFKTWNYDDVASKVAEYTEPSISFDLEVKECDEKNYVVLDIEEFEQVPILCKKDYPGVLRKGACYVRSQRKPETTEIPTQEDVRDLLDLPIEKGLRKYVTPAHGAGVGLVPIPTVATPSPAPATNQELYEKELGDLMSSLLDKIRPRGYWRVVIRPQTFVEKRISQITELCPIIQNTSAELRGWDFPHLDPRIQTHIDIDWIGQESEWEIFLEIWRSYQSGQSIDMAGMHEDWYDQRHSIPAAFGDWRPGLILGIRNTLFCSTEIFEFAARLAMAQAGDDTMHIEITVSNVAGRKL